MSVHAEYQLQASWDGANLGQFVIGFSQIAGPDTLGASFASRFDGDHDDLTGYLKSVTWSYGRAGSVGPAGQGTGRAVLTDRYGLFNPKNPDSPLTGKLKSMRPIRLMNTFEGVQRGSFYAFIDTIQHNPDPGVRETTITFFDLFEWLRRFKPTFSSSGLTNLGVAIGHVLDAVYWTEPGMRVLGRGDDIVEPAADGSHWALDIILEDYLAIDPGGIFFMDGPAGPGRAIYKSRHDLLVAPIAATFANTMSAVLPSTSSANIENRHQVTRTGGEPQVFTDSASVHDYAQRDGEQVESALLHDDAHAAALAAELGRRYGRPEDPVRNLVVKNGDRDRLLQILSREIGDRILVTETGGGSDGDFLIQQAGHEVTQKGKVHTATYALTERDDQTPFLIGSSLIDGTVPLIY